MKQQSEMLQRGGIITICIFQSTPENIAKYTKEKGMSLLLSDQECAVYNSWAGKKSSSFILVYGREIKSNIKRYKQYTNNEAFKEDVGAKSLTAAQLPATFLINEDGEIVDLFRADGVTDHMPLERVEAFIPEQKRCKCNKKDCISSQCRENYEEIKRQSEAFLYMG
jgi:peroxiredoxin